MSKQGKETSMKARVIYKATSTWAVEDDTWLCDCAGRLSSKSVFTDKDWIDRGFRLDFVPIQFMKGEAGWVR